MMKGQRSLDYEFLKSMPIFISKSKCYHVEVANTVTSTSSEGKLPEFVLQLCHSLALWLGQVT